MLSMNSLSPTFADCASQAADKIGVPQDATMERACIDLMYAIMLEDKGVKKNNPIEKIRYVEKETVAWVQPIYDFHEKFTADFCKNFQNIDHDALTAAMMCRGYLDRIDLIKGESRITPDIIRRADAILDEAETLYNKVLGYNQNFEGQDAVTKEPKIESVYLTHAFMAHETYSIYENDYSGFDKEDFEALRANTLTPIRAFAHGYTRLGNEMIQNINYIEGYLRAIACPEEHPANQDPAAPSRKHPPLTLI